jgi:arabinosaccharide transport system substrate-binding protein
MKRFMLAFLTTLIVASFGSLAANAQKTVELDFWTFVEKHQDYYEAKVAEFNKLHPEINLKLSATTYPYEEMHEKLLVSLVAGAGAPDIVDIEVAKFGSFLRGIIQLHDLTDLIEQYKGKLIDSRVALYSYKGIQYGIPTHLGAYVMYYNKELFDKEGIDLDSIKTWEDYVQVGKKITKGDQWMCTIETSDRNVYLGLAHQLEGGIYDSKGNMILDCDQNINALQFNSDLVHKHKIATIAPGGFHHDPTFYTFMNEGKAASIWMPQWFAIRFTEFMPDLHGKMRIRPMPRWDESVLSVETKKPGGYLSGMGGGTGTCITKQIKEDYIDIAKEFIGFSKLTYEANLSIWTDFGFDPFRKDVYDDPRLLEPLPYWGNEPVLNTIKKLFLDGEIPTEFLGPHYPEAVDMLFVEVPYNVIEKRMDPRKVLKEAADRVRAL